MVDEYARSFASMWSELQVERMRTIQVEWTNPFFFLTTWYDSAYHIHRMLCDLTIKVVNNKKTEEKIVTNVQLHSRTWVTHGITRIPIQIKFDLRVNCWVSRKRLNGFAVFFEWNAFDWISQIGGILTGFWTFY